jgi:hypothetical protein
MLTAVSLLMQVCVFLSTEDKPNQNKNTFIKENKIKILYDLIQLVNITKINVKLE